MFYGTQMNSIARYLVFSLAFMLSACAINPVLEREASERVQRTRNHDISCNTPDHCAIASSYQNLAAELLAKTASGAAPHAVNLLDHGENSLALRIHLIRAARHSIELQSFIFANDDVGFATLNELLNAARRGVKVRVLVDQLFSLDNRELLAQLARAHVNFELRVYNPTFDEATTQPLEFAAGIICCLIKMTQRAHNKLLLIDQRIAIIGGRNIEDRYFDLDPEFNYRDRDILVVGSEGRSMSQSFDQFWAHPRSRALATLKDVAKRIMLAGDKPTSYLAQQLNQASRLTRLQALSEDAAFIDQTFFQKRFQVDRLKYFSDPPRKRLKQKSTFTERIELTQTIAQLIRGAETEVMIQTPYMVLSKPARQAFLDLRRGHPDMRVIVSTNSLAATDAFPVYAISHKHRRFHLQKLGFELFEYKPYPGRSDQALKPAKNLSLFGSAAALGGKKAVPLKRDGSRRSMHAKTIVIDRQISLIGSHNFDPRSHTYNTENGVIVWDQAFAEAVSDSILRDIDPNESWVVAKKPDKPVLTSINQSIEKFSENLPFFDIWLWRYATSYELRPQCAPLSARDPRFHECYVRVGDFPEVNLSGKAIYTRIITAFGGGLTPIL